MHCSLTILDEYFALIFTRGKDRDDDVTREGHVDIRGHVAIRCWVASKTLRWKSHRAWEDLSKNIEGSKGGDGWGLDRDAL